MASTPEAPKEYSPEHCNWVHATSQAALSTAVETLRLVAKSQQDLTSQVIGSLESTQKKLIDENQKRKDDLSGFKIKMYAGAITALLFFIGFLYKLPSIIKGVTP